jgi:hypothetical protein
MPSPFLLLGVGERGKEVGEAFVQALRDDAPHFFPLAEVLNEPFDESGLVAKVEGLLRSAEQDWEQSAGPVLTWMVGDLAEDDVGKRIVQQADWIQQCFRDNFPTRSVCIESLLFVPQRKSERGDAIVEFLESFSQGNTSIQFCWLLSDGGRSLNEQELIVIGVKFLLLSFLTDLPIRIRAHGQLNDLRTRLGTFGLSGVIVPARELSRKEAARVSAQILEEVLKDDPGLVDPNLLRDFFRKHRLSMEELKAQLREGTRIALSERERKIALEMVNPSLWPDKLWSIYYFFAFGGLSPYFEGIRKNREGKWEEVAKDLAELVTGLVERGVQPSSALSFLEEVEKEAANLKGDQDRISPRAGKNLLQGAIEALREIYRDLPCGLGAVLLRVILLAVLVAYLFHLLLPQLLNLPEFSDPVFFLICLGFSAVLVGGLGLLSYMSKRHRFGEARKRAEDALWEALESALDAMAHNEAIAVLERLQCASASQDIIQKKGLPCEFEGNEYFAVLQYIAKLKGALERLNTMAGKGYQKVPVFWYLEDVPVSYKGGDYLASEEARIFVENGLHKGWREAREEDVIGKVLNLASAGLSPARPVEEILMGRKESDIRALQQGLVERASPLVNLSPSGSDGYSEARYLFVSDANSSQVVQRFDLKRPEVEVLSTGDRYGVFLLRAFLGIAPEEIMAFRIWKGGGADAG